MGLIESLTAKLRRDGDQLQPPTAMADGLTNGPDGMWAWVVIPPADTDNLNSDDLIGRTLAGGSDLTKLIPPGSDYHIKVQWGRWSGDEYLAEELRPGMNAGSVAWLELNADCIDRKAFPRRMVMIGERVDVVDVSPTAKLAGKAKKVAGTATAARSLENELARSLQRFRRFQDRMANSSFGARPATTQELAWSLRRDLRRTVDWVPPGAFANAGQVARLNSTQVVPYSDHVEITTDVGTSYLQMVIPTETGFPAGDLELPGGEWLKTLDLLGEDDNGKKAPPVELSIRGRNIPQIEAAKKISAALGLAKEQERTAGEGVAEDAPEMVAEARATLALRLKEVRSGHVGMMEDTPVWIVEADDLDTLAQRTDRLISFYGGMNISLWAPPNLQDLLWKETVIGDKRRVTAFAQFRPSSTLVGSWFHGGSQVGMPTGPYLGENIGSTPGPVRNRLTDGAKNRGKITSLFLGETGSAKSTSVMLHLLSELATMPLWVALLDLKGDLQGIVKACRMYGIPVTEVSTSEQASGSLCPFRWHHNPAEAASIAVDNLTTMLPAGEAGGDTESVLRRVANQISRLPHAADRSTAAIITALQNSSDPDEHALGKSLGELALDPLAIPVAGPPDLTAPALPTAHGLVYVRLDNMRWPGSTTPRSEWKPGHRLTAMIVQAIFGYMLYVAAQVKGIPKMLALAELHYITRYDFGRDLVGSTSRVGSALDVTQLLDTQACAELLAVDGLVDQVSNVYAFRVGTDDEADAQTRFLGRQPEKEFRRTQQSWGKGECLFRDAAGRVGPIKFDRLSTEIAAALDTTAKRNDISLQSYDLDDPTEDTAPSRINDWDTEMEPA